jgi:prepilin-type N-terminal cleavage/methylation domain-containing protein
MMIKNRHGFTLIEVLVASVVTMTAMLAATSALMDFLHNRHTSQTLGELALTGESIINHLSHDIHWGDAGIYTSPNIFSITIPDTTPITINYQLDLHGNLFRNEAAGTPVRLNNKNITVNEFKLDKYETVAGGSSDLWRITLKLTHNSVFWGNTTKAVFEQQTTISSRYNDIGG